MSIAKKFEIIADEVYDAGKKAQYDAFWDSFQQNGERTKYVGSFDCGWNAELFKPKYSMRPTTASRMFFNNVGESIDIKDFVEFCKENNIVLDFSNCTQADYCLATLHTNHLGILDFSKCTRSMQDMFYSHNSWSNVNGSWQDYTIHIIDEFISSAQTNFMSDTFKSAENLESIKMSGEVAKDITFQYCTKLNKASITSVINVLSTTTNGMTATFSQTAKEAAFTADEWSALIATKPNWTISLV